jgi:hypothetical protein
MTTTATTQTPRRVAGTVRALVGILFMRLRLAGPFDAWALRHWVPWWKVREDGIPVPRKHARDDDANAGLEPRGNRVGSEPLLGGSGGNE